MSALVVRSRDFIPADVRISPVTKGGTNKALRAFMSYRDSPSPIFIQTPRLMISCDPRISDQAKSGNNQAVVPSMALSFRSKNTDPTVNAFLTQLKAIDDLVLSHARNNAMTWFPNSKQIQASPDSVAVLHSPIIRKADSSPTDREYPESLWIKIDGTDVDGKITSDVPVYVDNNGISARKTISEVAKGMEAIAIIKIGPVWISPANAFGVSVYLSQIKVFPAQFLPDYAFLDDVPPPNSAPASPLKALADVAHQEAQGEAPVAVATAEEGSKRKREEDGEIAGDESEESAAKKAKTNDV